MSLASELISKESKKLLQFRIQQEEYSSRLYKQMSLFAKDRAYENSAKLFAKWADEELVHASWAQDFLLSFDIKPELSQLEQPIVDAQTIVDLFRLSYEHEIKIYNQCQDLAQTALIEGNFALMALAQKFLTEQVDEINKTQNLMTMIQTFGSSQQTLFLIDSHLSEYVN